MQDNNNTTTIWMEAKRRRQNLEVKKIMWDNEQKLQWIWWGWSAKEVTRLVSLYFPLHCRLAAMASSSSSSSSFPSRLYLSSFFSTVAQSYKTSLANDDCWVCVCVRAPLFVCLNDKFTIYYWFRCHKNSKLHFHLLFLLMLTLFLSHCCCVEFGFPFLPWKNFFICASYRQGICNYDILGTCTIL